MADPGAGEPTDRPEHSPADRRVADLGPADPADETENIETENIETENNEAENNEADAPRRAPDHWASEILD